MKNINSIHKTTIQRNASPINEHTVCYPTSNNQSKTSNTNQTQIKCYPGSNNESFNNSLFSLNPYIGYRTVNNTDKDALLEAFKQKIGYDVDQEILMDNYKQNLGTRVKNQKHIKNN